MPTIVERPGPGSSKPIITEIWPGSGLFFRNEKESTPKRIGRVASFGLFVHCNPYDLHGDLYVCTMAEDTRSALEDGQEADFTIVRFIRRIDDGRPYPVNMSEIYPDHDLLGLGSASEPAPYIAYHLGPLSKN